MMKRTLLDKVFDFTSNEGLFIAPCHVLLGLSGGADSMALLHILTHWQRPELQVSAIHVNHGLRGEDAERDERFVHDYCVQHHIPLTVVRVDVAQIAADRCLTVEEAGRQVRYEQFEMTRRVIGADYVLTAHNADDQAETVLMHLVRGCGVDGLTGIPVKREDIRRPLLCCARSEIEAYCDEFDIPYVTDATNFDTRYTRNDVRHRVMPLLREINPAINNALLRLSRLAGEDSACLNGLATAALDEARLEYGYSAIEMAKQPEAIRHRMVRILMRAAELSNIEESYIVAADEAILRNRGAVSLCGGRVFSVAQGVVTIGNDQVKIPPDPVFLDAFPCEVRFGDYNCAFTVGNTEDANVHKLFLQFSIDYDKIVGKLCLRCRQPGEVMHPCERNVGKSLKKLMNEMHIPANIRDAYPLLCDESGVVLLPGHTCDERVKITDTTKRYLVCDVSSV